MPCHRIINNNTTSATIGTGTAHPFGEPERTSDLCGVRLLNLYYFDPFVFLFFFLWPLRCVCSFMFFLHLWHQCWLFSSSNWYLTRGCTRWVAYHNNLTFDLIRKLNKLKGRQQCHKTIYYFIGITGYILEILLLSTQHSVEGKMSKMIEFWSVFQQ